MSLPSPLQAFLADGPYAVVGASPDRDKYGNKVLRCYLQHGREVYPIHPSVAEVEGQQAYPSLADLPVPVPSISVITPPSVTEKIVEQAAQAGVKRIWMQPGADSPAAIARARELGMEIIAQGPCLLVVLGYREG